MEKLFLDQIVFNKSFITLDGSLFFSPVHFLDFRFHLIAEIQIVALFLITNKLRPISQLLISIFILNPVL